jgi:hypothetical protein
MHHSPIFSPVQLACDGRCTAVQLSTCQRRRHRVEVWRKVPNENTALQLDTTDLETATAAAAPTAAAKTG